MFDSRNHEPPSWDDAYTAEENHAVRKMREDHGIFMTPRELRLDRTVFNVIKGPMTIPMTKAGVVKALQKEALFINEDNVFVRLVQSYFVNPERVRYGFATAWRCYPYSEGWPPYCFGFETPWQAP